MNLNLGMAAAALAAILAGPASAQSGAAARGERVFRACAPCHSLVISDNAMTFRGIKDAQQRADLIAY